MPVSLTGRVAPGYGFFYVGLCSQSAYATTFYNETAWAPVTLFSVNPRGKPLGPQALPQKQSTLRQR